MEPAPRSPAPGAPAEDRATSRPPSYWATTPRARRTRTGLQGLGGTASQCVGDQVGCAALRPGHRHGRCLRQCQDLQQRQFVHRPGSALEGGGERGLHDEPEVSLQPLERLGQRRARGPDRQRTDDAWITAPTRRVRARPTRRGTSRARRSTSIPAPNEGVAHNGVLFFQGVPVFREPVAVVSADQRTAQRLPAAHGFGEFDHRLRNGDCRITSTSRRIAICWSRRA